MDIRDELFSSQRSKKIKSIGSMRETEVSGNVEYDGDGNVRYDFRVWYKEATNYLKAPDKNPVPGRHPDPNNEWNKNA